MATAAVAGVTALDVVAARRLGSVAEKNGAGAAVEDVRLVRSIIIDRTPEEIYNYWLDLENLPRFMKYLESVRLTEPNESHWAVRTSGGKQVEWNAEEAPQGYDIFPNKRQECVKVVLKPAA